MVQLGAVRLDQLADLLMEAEAHQLAGEMPQAATADALMDASMQEGKGLATRSRQKKEEEGEDGGGASSGEDLFYHAPRAWQR